MSVTIGANTYTYLDAQPAGYDEKDTEKGLTIRKWKLSGFLTEAEWTGLISAYETWRDLRFDDPDSVATNSVGTTILFSTTEPPAVSSIACWFTKAPQATREGTLWNASAEVVDAAQALAVAIKQKDKDKEQEVKDQDQVDLGTLNVGGVVLTLTAVPDTFQDPPKLNLTAQGTHYISGPIGATLVRDVAGYTDAAGWNTLRDWYAAQSLTTPARNDWYPVTPPTASAENIIIAGLKVIRYNVKLTLVRVR